MDEMGNSASEEMPELTETFENRNNNKKMTALYATVIKKHFEKYDEEYGVTPIFILDSDIFGSATRIHNTQLNLQSHR